ncbi:MFS transporter [Sedimentibacter hydroxybenzoicus DSM 7310]|uniref:MFS transporter n=1 Tax=Sedimentibacter hydroxybenzoicus DSM 7310 TaxID=1123245 RepID=A0A974GX41_SEDHY|nr:MFS transporter [Sedimentibacter hydroxybenzoicus]NYB75174.1 MFS transporter [Sedimentibacter hydroxybenzoicus DSM 7310]
MRKYNSSFILFLAGRMVSDTGTSIQMMILPLYIIDIGGNASDIGIFSFISLTPALFIYPFAGVLGDKFNRKKIMIMTDFLSGVIILAFACISYLDKMSIILLMIGMAIISMLNGLFDPATRGMLPKLVEKDELTKANSTVASLRGLSVLLGPVIGAVLYSNYGVAVLFLINGFSFLISGISEILIKYNHVNSRLTECKQGMLKDLYEGIKFIINNKLISKLCWFYILIYTSIQPIFSVVLPLFYKTQLKFTDVQYGYLQSISIFGMLLSSIAVGLAYKKEKGIIKPFKIGIKLLVCCMIIFSFLVFPDVVFLLGNGSTIYFLLLSAVVCLFSSATTFINVPIQSYIQRETPDEYISRVFSIVGMITRGGMPLGSLVYGIILNNVSIQMTVFAASMLIIIYSAAFIINFQKNLLPF